jgi:hypothetical protein
MYCYILGRRGSLEKCTVTFWRSWLMLLEFVAVIAVAWKNVLIHFWVVAVAWNNVLLHFGGLG